MAGIIKKNNPKKERRGDLKVSVTDLENIFGE